MGSTAPSTALPSTFGPLLLAAACLGIAVAFNNGAYEPRAICVLFAGVLLLAWCFFAERRGGVERGADAMTLAPGLLVGLAVCLFWGWNDDGLIMYAQRSWSTGRSAMSWMAIVLVTYLPALWLRRREPTWLGRARFGLLVGLVLIAGIDTLHVSPKPWIDVWTVQQQGAEALLHGHNPYTSVAAADTTPGRSGPTPYVYPPTQVLVGLFGFALFHDVRYSMLAAVLVAGVSMRLITERAAAPDVPWLTLDAPALFLFFTPKLFFILEQSWVDPIQLGILAAAACLFVYRKRRAAVIVFGIAASSKQTLFWVIPLVGFGLGFSLREWITMGIAAAVPVVPFFLWDAAALKHSNFDFLANIPPRPDALTLGNWMNRRFATELTGVAAFPLSALAVLWAGFRVRGMGGVTVAFAFVYVLFFAFNKQAFANYYFFVAGLAALGAALHLAAVAPEKAFEKASEKTKTVEASPAADRPDDLNEDASKGPSPAPESASSSA